MAVMLAYLKVPLSWREILTRTVREAMADNIFGMSAQLAYYFFFALFPALLLLIAMASYLPEQTLINQVFSAMRGFAPPAALTIITDQIQKITDAKPSGLLTFGVAMAVWSCSSAMSAIINTLNSAYDIDEGRPWWKVQLTAVCLTLGVALFIIISFRPHAGHQRRRLDAPGTGLRMELEDFAVAGHLRARLHRHRARVLPRA